jgi:hypothetical protein
MTISKGYLSRADVSNAPGAFAIIFSGDFGTIQAALPSVAESSTADYYAHVPNSANQWKVQKTVDYMNPDGAVQTTGIGLAGIVAVAPPYPGTSQALTTASIPMVLNGYAFRVTTNGTTAATFIGFSKFNTTPGGTTTDGTVVWTCYGKAIWLRFHFVNTLAGSAATPVATTWELFQQ